MIYPSVQRAGRHSNVVLFNKASRVEDLELPTGTETSAYLSHTDDDGEWPDYWVWEETPEKPIEPDKGRSSTFFDPMRFLDSPEDSAFDDRQASLRIVLDSVHVHHIKAVSFKAEKYPVRRHRVEKGSNKF